MQATYIIIICIGVLYLIIKKVNPQGILFIAGALFFAGAMLFGWGKGAIPIAKATGSSFFDYFEFVKEMFSSKLAGIGLKIMAVGGFATYLAHMKASNKLVEYSIKPLSIIKEPYILLSLFYILSVFLNMFITSATGLGLLLMVTVYPILRGMGISKYSAVGMIVTTGCLELGPVQANVIIASKLSGMDVTDYFVKYEFIAGAAAMIVIAIAHYFWQKRCDKKMGLTIESEKISYSEEYSEGGNVTDLKSIPFYYAIYPVIPFVIVILFSKLALSWGLNFGIKLSIIPALFFSVFIIMVIDFIKNRANIKMVLDNFNAFLKGMEGMFPVVSLIVAGNVFAKGLSAIGAIDMLINAAESSGLGSTGMIIVMVLIIMLASALIGSGNATFIPLANIAPPVAGRFGIPAVAMLLPMQLVSSLARVLSPIVAVGIACAGIAKIDTVSVVKRTYVPIILGIIVMVITSLIIV